MAQSEDQSKMEQPKSPFEQLLNHNDALICQRQEGNVVVAQNEVGIATCGNQVGQKCEQPCAALEVTSRHPTVLKSAQIVDRRFHVTVLPLDKENLTIGLPIQDDLSRVLNELSTLGLTSRELEVAAEIAGGLTNNEIAKKLSVSKTTVKTHINNIHHKIGDRYFTLLRSKR